MPLYEYQCEACGSRFEKIRKFSDPPLEVCEKCGKGPIVKLLSSPAIQFKGSGFYITDYPKKSSSESSSKSSSSSESSAETKKTDAPAATTTTSDKSDKKD
jgi:putative FmdB family regulatory protein